ncbi:MlaE family ABC transporter permease [Geminicoccus roseus]|uniref:MlaE family ABC transporter permease n=1 Tax=Geminicoccus roseus TaxID=404900 RepID=UPI00041ABEE5|nr:ABC transporter permease [Geminicoccus roseus]
MTASIRAEREDDAALVTAAGSWLVDQAAMLSTRLGRLPLRLAGAGTVTLDLRAIERLDTTGAWLLARTERSLEQAGFRVTTRPPEGAGDAELLRHVRDLNLTETQLARPAGALVTLLARTGAWVTDALHQAVGVLGFFGAIVLRTLSALVRPREIRWTALVHHLEQTGLGAIGITALLSFLIGLVMAWQGAAQLVRFGADIFTVDLLSISVLRELGVLLTAIIVAGRTASAFTAQIGSMVLNEEIDAMRVIGLDPVDTLVLPRFFALLLALPILTFIADAAALAGGAVVVLFDLDIPWTQMISRFGEVATFTHFAVGMVKAPVFAFAIALIGCWNGLRVERNSESVGRMTTQSVVASIFLVIVVDAMFSILFVRLGV